MFSLFHGSGELVWTYLDAGYLIMVANSQLPEAKFAQRGLGLLNLSQLLGGDLRTVGNPGREAGVGGAVPVGETQFLCPAPDFLLADPGFLEGTADPVFPGGSQAGAMVPDVVRVGAVQDPVKPSFAGEVDEALVDIRFAEVAALRVVALVAGVLGLLTPDQLVVRSDLPCNTASAPSCSEASRRTRVLSIPPEKATRTRPQSLMTFEAR